MSDIRFDGEDLYQPRPTLAQNKGLTGLVLRWGLARDARRAQYVLLAVALGALVLALCVLAGSGVIGSGAPLPPPPP